MSLPNGNSEILSVAHAAAPADAPDRLRPESFSEAEWNDWRWQVRHAIRSVGELRRWINVTAEEADAIGESAGKYRWSISPYYASLLDPDDPDCPLRRQVVPHPEELAPAPDADVDPVEDQFYRKTNRVIHKYPDRVAFLVTAKCPVYCRHCTRKYHTTEIGGTYFAESEAKSMEKDFEYIRQHPEIRDVSLSGGDPLSYPDARLETIIASLRAIPHVEIIRIGSRLPVLLPQRITPELCEMLDRYQPFWINTHFNHPSEITPEAAVACDRLLRHGVPVGNQTVLLRGVNDNVETMRRLCTELVRIRVRPYYLYHCDNVRGVSHFATSLAKGREIMEGLTMHITGFAVPQYVVTTRIGKIPAGPDYLEQSEDGVRVRNWKGQTYEVPWFNDGAPDADDLTGCAAGTVK